MQFKNYFNYCLAFLIGIQVYVATAEAADKVVYINTTCTNNGNGTASSCAGSPGGAGAYKTCQQASDGEVIANADITTLTNHLIINASGATADVQCTFPATFITNTSHRIKFNGNLTGGLWDATKWHITDNVTPGAIVVQTQFMEFDHIQAQNTGTGSGNNSGIHDGGGEGGQYLKVTNSILRGSTSTGTSRGIYCRPDVANASCIVANNIVYGWTGANSTCYGLNGAGYNSGEVIIAYNNTCHGAQLGYETHGGGTGDAQYFINNIAQSNAGGGYSLDAATPTLHPSPTPRPRPWYYRWWS